MTGIDHCDWEDVSCNNSEGYVTFLNLYENQLTGPIPQSIGNLDNLLRLDLHGNELTGPIPETIGDLIHLERLWIFENEELDPTPNWLTTFCESRTKLSCWF